MKEDLKLLKELIQAHSDQLVDWWLEYFNEEDVKSEEARYYDDFLGFFEEALESDLDPNSDEAQALKLFLKKLIDIKGINNFFHFQHSVYTCFLKFPLLQGLEENGHFNFSTVSRITAFFEALTSAIIIEILQKNTEIQQTTLDELEEREAPISEIWDGVLMVSIVGTLDSNRVLKIIDKTLHHLNLYPTEHVIIDIGAIFDMNSEVASQIIKLNNAIHFMGSKAYLTGITPAIAKSLTHLDISLGDIKTFSSTKKAMKMIIDG